MTAISRRSLSFFASLVVGITLFVLLSAGMKPASAAEEMISGGTCPTGYKGVVITVNDGTVMVCVKNPPPANL